MRITKEQAAFFKDSVVRDKEGNLLPVYHGTGTTILAFDPEYTGQGNDQYGSGFYFSTSFDDAAGYTTATLTGDNGEALPKLGGTDSPNVIEAYLNITNPIVVANAREHANLRYFAVSPLDAEKILRYHPDIYRQIDDSEEHPNPLGDYIEAFWSRDDWEKEDFDVFIHQMAQEYFRDTNLLLLDCFFRDYPTEMRKACKDVLGYDGVKICFDNVTHYVAWFPEQIKRTTNQNPTNSNLIDN